MGSGTIRYANSDATELMDYVGGESTHSRNPDQSEWSINSPSQSIHFIIIHFMSTSVLPGHQQHTHTHKDLLLAQWPVKSRLELPFFPTDHTKAPNPGPGTEEMIRFTWGRHRNGHVIRVGQGIVNSDSYSYSMCFGSLATTAMTRVNGKIPTNSTSSTRTDGFGDPKSGQVIEMAAVARPLVQRTRTREQFWGY